MQIKKEIKRDSYAVKITIEDNGQTLGRAYLYIIYNGQQAEPYGFLEDVFVEETARGQGIGTQLVEAAIAEAKTRGCAKIRFTSRRSRTDIHQWYEKMGFEKYGFAFKMELK